ncbi:helix-turn-helix domain-containing protein [Amycolatopsis echigonensis]|uniref:XRE family transcriptional regulator n=1 Tax=Amycolatopsis echigonensis TaxID=2576905 RepID=A0A8E2B793_9PSEU|nr:Scr1 family TA system antitoxin-like transcriptional regulator [Amycolatopsis echigonensis]MBB2503027.1 XRE family transcriptional regulator [Amycolatopsis echigonensis]
MRDSEMPGPPERVLGTALRNARIEASFGLRELGRWLGVDAALLSSWELGEQVPTLEDVAGVLGALGVVGEKKARIMALARELAGASWIMPGSQADTAHHAIVAGHERNAESVTVWAPLRIPDLLQIPDYVRLVFGPSLWDQEVLERVVQNRLSRNRILFGVEAVEAQLFVGTEALRNDFGDAEVMLRQMRYLVEVSQRVKIRIVPSQAVTEGAFSWYRQRDETDVVYCPHHRAGVFLAGRQAAPYAGTIERLAEAALSAEDSLHRLSAAAAGFAEDVKARRLANDAGLTKLLAGEDPAG